MKTFAAAFAALTLALAAAAPAFADAGRIGYLSGAPAGTTDAARRQAALERRARSPVPARMEQAGGTDAARWGSRIVNRSGDHHTRTAPDGSTDAARRVVELERYLRGRVRMI